MDITDLKILSMLQILVKCRNRNKEVFPNWIRRSLYKTKYTGYRFILAVDTR